MDLDTKPPIIDGLPTSVSNHRTALSEGEVFETPGGERVQLIYMQARPVATDFDLRAQALDKAVYAVGSNRLGPEEVIPVAEEFYAFLKGESQS